MDNDDIITITGDIGDIYIDTNTIDTTVCATHSSWLSIGNLTTDTIDLSGITFNEPVEFEDVMPDVAKVEDMCNDYPALAKAYENFRTIYKMVHQDWKGRQDDEPPF